MRFLDRDTVRHLGWQTVIDALADGFSRGEDGRATPRQAVPVDRGELLVMPAQGSRHFGAKLVGVAAHAGAGPRIQGVVVLFDQTDLSPVAVIDGTELTLRRTAGVSALAARALSARAGHVTVFGAGPQARAHVAALATLGLVRSVSIRARSQDAVRALEDELRATHPFEVIPEAPLDRASIVVCATTAAEPLFHERELTADATVLAIGSHEPAKRELPTGLVAGAFTAVDSRAAAAREAGDIIIAARESGRPVVDAALAELLRGEVRRPAAGRAVFKSVGEGWQDLAVAGALVPEEAR